MERLTCSVLGTLLASLVLTSCWQYRAGWESALRSRAAFEFQCPADQIVITPLTVETFGNTDAPLNQGVTGCGKRAVYTATISGYVSNTAATQPAPQP